MSKMKLTIAITGLNNTDNPGPGIPVIRGIRDSNDFDVTIIGLAYENLEPGIYMHDIVDRTYRIPYPSEGTEGLLERVLEINTIENIDLIIPNFDSELISFIKSEATLNSAGIRTFLPSMSQYLEREKSDLPAYGKKYRVKVPFSKPVTSISDLDSLSDEFE